MEALQKLEKVRLSAETVRLKRELLEQLERLRSWSVRVPQPEERTATIQAVLALYRRVMDLATSTIAGGE